MVEIDGFGDSNGYSYGHGYGGDGFGDSNCARGDGCGDSLDGLIKGNGYGGGSCFDCVVLLWLRGMVLWVMAGRWKMFEIDGDGYGYDYGDGCGNMWGDGHGDSGDSNHEGDGFGESNYGNEF